MGVVITEDQQRYLAMGLQDMEAVTVPLSHCHSHQSSRPGQSRIGGSALCWRSLRCLPSTELQGFERQVSLEPL